MCNSAIRSQQICRQNITKSGGLLTNFVHVDDTREKYKKFDKEMAMITVLQYSQY